MLGGIAGFAEQTITIKKSFNEGIIKTDKHSAGGIIGQLYTGKGTIEQCYNANSVQAQVSMAGGIAGFFGKGEIKQCYNKGTITAMTQSAGGIIGNFQNTTQVTDCYNTATITSTNEKYRGGIAGGATTLTGTATGDYKITINNCYLLENKVDKSLGQDALLQGDDAIVKSEADMKTQEFVDSLGNTIWKIDKKQNNGYPIFLWQ